MSEPFHTRAAEIIAAYGADAARWPDAERATALHVVAASPVLSAMLAEAHQLDAEMKTWAQVPLASGVTAHAASDAAARAMRRPRPVVRWAMGTGLAASLAAGLLLVAPTHRPAPSTAPRMVAVASVASDDATAFAQVFTPTPDEEQSL